MWHNVNTDDANNMLLGCCDMQMALFREVKDVFRGWYADIQRLSIDFYSASVKEAKPEIPLKTLKIKHLKRCNRKGPKPNADILRAF